MPAGLGSLRMNSKILLAEDDTDMRRFLVKALQNAGFEVAFFEEPSGEVEAGRVVRTTPGPGELLARGGTVTIVLSSGPLALGPGR